MRRGRDAVIAFSLANLLFLSIWRPFFIGRDVAYYYGNLPGWIDLAAVTLDVLLVAAILYAGAVAVRRSRSPQVRTAARVLFLALFVVGTFQVSPETNRIAGVIGSWIPRWFWQFDMPFEQWLAFVLAPTMLAVTMIVLIFAKRVARAGLWFLSDGRPVKVATALLLIFSPAGLVIFANTVGLVSGYVAVPGFGPRAMPAPAPPSTHQGAGRVLWIVLDEWDRGLTFDRRPADIALPELDAFRRQSLDAINAQSPDSRTLTSLPTLISGARVFDAYATDSATLMLTFRGRGTHQDWRTIPNVFSRARERGAQTALVGWYHPYSRLFADQVVRCYSKPSFELNTLFPDRPTLGGQMYRFAVHALRNVPILPRLVPGLSNHMRYKTAALEIYGNIREASHLVALDPNIDLAMLHWSIPHPPGVSIPGTGTPGLDRESSYFDNLVLADRAIGELRREMEAAGLWDRTTILVSSDHPARLNLWQQSPEWLSERDEEAIPPTFELPPTIPFLLRLAGAHEGTEYARPFNAVLSQGLLLAVLDGEVSTDEAAAAWLDSHAAESLKPDYGAP